MREPCHALVFRDVRGPLPLATAAETLCGELRAFQESSGQTLLLGALLRAGELECALADQRHPQAKPFSGVTDLIANALLDPCHATRAMAPAISIVRQIGLSGDAPVSRPEGFAFYALHPLDYADLVIPMAFDAQRLIVIGIRTIGTTLSAVTAAALRKKFGREVKVERFTVRPLGHPYDRVCEFSEEQKQAIRGNDGAQVLVVDEGPGLSGSSFLSVGEALVALGVGRDHIVFLCSHDADPASLVTCNGAARWRAFKSVVVPRNRAIPQEGASSLAAGEWRKYPDYDEQSWPGLWTQMSAARFSSADGRYIFKYEGLGRYGDVLRERVNVLADAGFTMHSAKAPNGFSEYTFVPGRTLQKQDLSLEVLERIAEYLAFRSLEFCVDPRLVAADQLETMARFNFAQATGNRLPKDFSLDVKRPVIADGRMMPHEWLQPDFGNALLKLDCASHGDDHFFPGPVDIAWDVAGTILEWEIDPDSAEHFVARYESHAGDDVRSRLESYLIAYAAFRNGYCRMAASAMESCGPQEAARLRRDAAKYAKRLRSYTSVTESQANLTPNYAVSSVCWNGPQ